MVNVWEAIKPPERPIRGEGRDTFSPPPRIMPPSPAATNVPAPIAEPSEPARRPIAAPRPELSDLPTPETYAEALRLGFQNIPESAGRVGGSLVQAVTHPIETAKALGNVGYGLGSMAYGALGGQQDPEEKARNEAAARGVIDMYGEYFEPGGLRRAIAYQPVETLLDVSLPVTGAGGALRGAAGATSRIGRLGTAIETVGRTMDPVQSALSVARGAASIPVRAMRLGQATASRVPYNTLNMIYDLGRSGTRDQRAAYAAGLNRNLDEGVIVQRAVDSLNSAADEASKSYISGRSHLAGVSPNVSEIYNAIDKARDNLLVSGSVPRGHQAAFDELAKIQNELTQYVNSGRFDLIQADAWKRSLYNLSDGVGDRTAKNSIDAVSKSVKDAIAGVDPSYANLMEQWQQWIRTAKGLREGGASGNISVASAMSRLLNSMKTGLKQKNVVDVLAKKDPELPYLLAGYATRDLHRGQIGLMEALLGGGLYFAMQHPAGVVGGIAAASPRLGGLSQYALGRAAGAGRTATQPAITYGAYYGSQADRPTEGPGGGDPEQIQRAIAAIESGGSGDYNALGRVTESGDRAYGRYQIMGANIGPWSRKHLGREVSIEEFLRNPEIQDQIAASQIREYFDQYGNAEDVLSMWHSGIPASRSGSRQDILGTTTPEYIARGMQAMDREGRASGGRIMNHKQEAERLILAAANAKRKQSDDTERLLQLPDESVTHALAVANESI